MNAVFLFFAIVSLQSAQARDVTFPPAAMLQVGSKQQIHVTLKPANAQPGKTFSTPLYLATSPDVKLRHITVQLSYPNGVFSFSHAEKGFLLQSGRFEVEAATSPHARDKSLESLRIQVKANPEDANASLPTGLILYLRFSVPENAEAALITLQNEIVGAEAVGATRLSKSRWVADSQTVTIATGLSPILACFFYLH